MVLFRSEYFFAFDLVSSVMHAYVPGWHPVSLLSRTPSEKSQFSGNIRRAVKSSLDRRLGNRASILFDYWFKGQLIDLDNCESFIKQVTIEYCLMGYRPEVFLEACVLIAEFSALAYIYGVFGAPQFGIFCITHLLCYYRNEGQFKESSSWWELERFAYNLV